MKTCIVSSLIWFIMASAMMAIEIPAKYSAFRKSFGEWSGTVELEIRTAQGNQKFKYPKSSVCHFDPQRDSIVMRDSETHPWNEKKVDAITEIRWDEISKCFKAITWGTDGGVRLFVIEQKGESLLFRQVDSAPGEKLESEASINQEGRLVEKGSATSRDVAGGAIEWSVVYEKVVKKADK